MIRVDENETHAKHSNCSIRYPVRAINEHAKHRRSSDNERGKSSLDSLR